jgi:hypothetical protein
MTDAAWTAQEEPGRVAARLGFSVVTTVKEARVIMRRHVARERTRPRDPQVYCKEDGQAWPCDARSLAGHIMSIVNELEAEIVSPTAPEESCSPGSAPPRRAPAEGS